MSKKKKYDTNSYPTQPWSRHEKESEGAYIAFKFFLHLDTRVKKRSVRRAFDEASEEIHFKIAEKTRKKPGKNPEKTRKKPEKNELTIGKSFILGGGGLIELGNTIALFSY